MSEGSFATVENLKFYTCNFRFTHFQNQINSLIFTLEINVLV